MPPRLPAHVDTRNLANTLVHELIEVQSLRAGGARVAMRGPHPACRTAPLRQLGASPSAPSRMLPSPNIADKTSLLMSEGLNSAQRAHSQRSHDALSRARARGGAHHTE